MSYKLTGENWILRVADQAHIPMSVSNQDYQDYLAWVAAGNTPLPADPEAPEAIKARLSQAVQAHLDAKARDYRYESILSARTALSSHIQKFADEGAAFNTWWGNVWAYVDQVEQDVSNALRAVPTEAELIAELPAFVAP